MKSARHLSLNQWMKCGGNGLSNYVEAWVAQVEGISRGRVRAMTLEEIFSVPEAGVVAEREITRFLNERFSSIKLPNQ